MDTKSGTIDLRAASQVVRLLIVALACACALPALAHASAGETTAMYRLYNPNSGEHFYTAYPSERNSLVSAGWRYEGVGWVAPKASKSPVYRLYNAYAGDHHYTISAKERDGLVKLGWEDEGVGWYSDDSETVPLYRQYNPHASAGTHNYTTSKNENDRLVSVGWREEGIGWYGVGEGYDDRGSFELAPIDINGNGAGSASYSNDSSAAGSDAFAKRRAEYQAQLEHYKSLRSQRMRSGPGIKDPMLYYSSPSYRDRYDSEVQELRSDIASLDSMIEYYQGLLDGLDKL